MQNLMDGMHHHQLPAMLQHQMVDHHLLPQHHHHPHQQAATSESDARGPHGGGNNNSSNNNEELEMSKSGTGSDNNLDGGEDDEQEDPTGQHPRKKKRYHRHTQHQIQELEAFFKECPHPDDKQRKELSRSLSLEPLQVKFWFQNKRTQIKTQHERQENTALRTENEKLRAENMRYKEALANASCPNCGGPAAIGEMSFDEHHLRVENARLRDEIDRISATAGTGAEDVRVMTRKSVDDPGRPPGIILNAATSFWLPVPPSRVFGFLRDDSTRSEWDILSNGGGVQEMAHIANGSHHGNAVSLLRVNNANSNQSNMLILQECCTDTTGSYVVYAPVDVVAMNVVLNGGDPDYVALLPSGFATLPEGPAGAPDAGGSLLTVAFQILVDSVPTAKLSLGSVATVNSLIACTVDRIKAAVVVSPGDNTGAAANRRSRGTKSGSGENQIPEKQPTYSSHPKKLVPQMDVSSIKLVLDTSICGTSLGQVFSDGAVKVVNDLFPGFCSKNISGKYDKEKEGLFVIVNDLDIKMESLGLLNSAF
uniref:Homeobox-leucine zipper protein ROC7 n=1 Tax=Aegilops tauschii TaxID=37682 RepID=M8AUY8_AEGTA